VKATSPGLETTPARRVQVMATCLCDVFYDDVAVATVEVLEHLGCSVIVPLDQTCCGQPAFNAGDWAASRPVARHALRVFAGDGPVVIPSGSCAKMVSHGAMMLFEREPDLADAAQLAQRTWELSDFIVNGLGITEWPGRFEARLAVHRSCHSRGTRYADAALTLLRSIQGVTVAEFGEAEQCCGFGGTFAVAFPNISSGIGGLKLDHILAAAPDVIVSGDMGCLMHLEGLARKDGRHVRMLHVAQVLRDALQSTHRAGPR
jgi:L-lactate dehydrogenase complex protein LldE